MILGRYLSREITRTLLGVLAILLLIYISNRFVRFLAEASAGELSGQLIYQLLALKTLSAMTLLIPLAFFFSVLLTMGRLYQDQEMAVISACGVSPAWVMRRVLLLALGVSLIVAAISMVLAPWAEATSDSLIDAQNTKPEVTSIAPGRFHEIKDGQGVIYIEKQNRSGTEVETIFVRQIDNGREVIITAPRAFFDSEHSGPADYLLMKDGFRFENNPGKARFAISDFVSYGLLLKDRPPSPSVVQTRELATSDLDWGFGPQLAELQWRISQPLSVLLLAMLAVPLSGSRPRQGRFSSLFMAILVYAIYNNLLGVSKHWVAQSMVSPWIGVWWVHALLFCWAFFLFISGNRPGRRSWRMYFPSGRAKP